MPRRWRAAECRGFVREKERSLAVLFAKMSPTPVMKMMMKMVLTQKCERTTATVDSATTPSFGWQTASYGACLSTLKERPRLQSLNRTRTLQWDSTGRTHLQAAKPRSQTESHERRFRSQRGKLACGRMSPCVYEMSKTPVREVMGMQVVRAPRLQWGCQRYRKCRTPGPPS